MFVAQDRRLVSAFLGHRIVCQSRFMSLYTRLKPNGKNGFGSVTTAENVTVGLDLRGKTILVTGCNSGLGLETMRVLALRGAHVLGTARTLEKAERACTSVAGRATGFACELADPASVRASVDSIKRAAPAVDAVIANAGIMALPKLQQAFGYELQFFTNHVGHFLLVTGLLDQLSDDARVVMLSSSAHTRAPKGGIEFDNLSGERGYSAWSAYGQSKFANLLCAKELSRQFTGTNKTANAVHPGVIQTNLGRSMNPLFSLGWSVANPIAMKNVHEGAATQTFVATHPLAADISGAYFADCNVTSCRSDANDAELARRLWDVSREIVNGL